jgi:hypothetical protein
MKKKSLFSIILIAFIILTSSGQLNAQDKSTRKAEKEAQEILEFARIDSLVNSRQFVFQEQFDQGSGEVFILIDSGYAMLQYGNRNNLNGEVTNFVVKKNEKKRNLSVEINMRGDLYTGDIFLFIGSSGTGRANIRSEFPGDFTFDGDLVTFEDASIDVGPSHFIR